MMVMVMVMYDDDDDDDANDAHDDEDGGGGGDGPALRILDRNSSSVPFVRLKFFIIDRGAVFFTDNVADSFSFELSCAVLYIPLSRNFTFRDLIIICNRITSEKIMDGIFRIKSLSKTVTEL